MGSGVSATPASPSVHRHVIVSSGIFAAAEAKQRVGTVSQSRDESASPRARARRDEVKIDPVLADLDRDMLPFMVLDAGIEDTFSRVVWRAATHGLSGRDPYWHDGYLSLGLSAPRRARLHLRRFFCVLHNFVLYYGSHRELVLHQALQGDVCGVNTLPMCNIARIEASRSGIDTRFSILVSLTTPRRAGSARPRRLVAEAATHAAATAWITCLRATREAFWAMADRFKSHDTRRTAANS